jgi:DNA-binding XRE family transcriptional regulator
MPTQTHGAARDKCDASAPPRTVRLKRLPPRDQRVHPERELYSFELVADEQRKPLTAASFVDGHFGGLMQAHGQRIKDLRTKRGMSQDALARATGLTNGRVRRIENDYKANPRLKTMCLIAEALGVDVKELL